MATPGRQPKDLKGQTIGYLTVLEMMEGRWYQGSRVWLCRCVCGQEVYFSARQLGIAGKPKDKNKPNNSKWPDSCGCMNEWRPTTDTNRLSLENFSTEGAKCETLSQRYSSYKYGAKTRGYTFQLTLQEFNFITQEDCFYCGKKAEPFNGVDRYINKLDYTIENSVPCCTSCNKMKLDKNGDEFIEMCKRVATKQSPS